MALQGEGVPVTFAPPKEGALTRVCGMTMHKHAPKPDRAYDILNPLISAPSGVFIINDNGYG